MGSRAGRPWPIGGAGARPRNGGQPEADFGPKSGYFGPFGSLFGHCDSILYEFLQYNRRGAPKSGIGYLSPACLPLRMYGPRPTRGARQVQAKRPLRQIGQDSKSYLGDNWRTAAGSSPTLQNSTSTQLALHHPTNAMSNNAPTTSTARP